MQLPIQTNSHATADEDGYDQCNTDDGSQCHKGGHQPMIVFHFLNATVISAESWNLT